MITYFIGLVVLPKCQGNIYTQQKYRIILFAKIIYFDLDP